MTRLHPLAPALSHPSPARAEVSPLRLIAGALLAPIGYGAQVVIGYTIGAVGCARQLASWPVLLVVTVVALAAIFAGLAVSIGNFRRTRHEAEGDHARLQDRGEGRTRFLAYCGLCSSGIFASAALVQLASMIVLHQCVGARPLG